MPTDGLVCPCAASVQAAAERSTPTAHRLATQIASCSCKKKINQPASPESLQLEAESIYETRSSNFTVDGSKPLPGSKYASDGLYPTNHAEHETVEITQGINDWSEVGFYIFISARDGDGWQWVGDHIRPRVRVPDGWHWPVGVSLSTEVGYQRRQFSTDTWTWEIRPIVDKTIGRWYFAVNPALERSFHGQTVNQGVGFSPNAKVSYDFNKYISGDLEYYADYGSLDGFESFHNQQQQFFPAVDLNVSPNWEINFGVGVGPTSATDHLIVKGIVGRRFDWTHHRAGSSESIG